MKGPLGILILLIDNYDSFVHNLARYFARLGQETSVFRNDVISTTKIHSLRPQAIVLSPGPCTPSEAGCSLSVVNEFVDKIPILGICLGHQTIANVWYPATAATPPASCGRGPGFPLVPARRRLVRVRA